MVNASACERARTWLSLRLDGELSEMENALLESHLGRCASCTEAADRITGLTLALRAAPLEAPATQVTVPRQMRIGSLRRFYVAAVAVLVLALAASGVGSVAALQVVATRSAPPKIRHVSAVATGMSDDLQLLAGVRVLRNERPVPGRIAWPA
jgi:predicted anti-sigma-YlaC factor YlaD